MVDSLSAPAQRSGDVLLAELTARAFPAFSQPTVDQQMAPLRERGQEQDGRAPVEAQDARRSSTLAD
jgi:hypothetical protein